MQKNLKSDDYRKKKHLYNKAKNISEKFGKRRLKNTRNSTCVKCFAENHFKNIKKLKTKLVKR